MVSRANAFFWSRDTKKDFLEKMVDFDANGGRQFFQESCHELGCVLMRAY